MFSLRSRNEHRRRDNKIHAPEFLMTGNVLHRHSASALAYRLVIAALLVVRQFALGMGMKISAIAAQREHQQKLGVHARGRNVRGGEAGNGRSQSFTQGHRYTCHTTLLASAFIFSAW